MSSRACAATDAARDGGGATAFCVEDFEPGAICGIILVPSESRRARDSFSGASGWRPRPVGMAQEA